MYAIAIELLDRFFACSDKDIKEREIRIFTH